MNSCSSTYCHGGPCTCGNHEFYNNYQKPSFDEYYCSENMYSYASSSSVDCTLSLGTPSTRLSSSSTIDNHEKRVQSHETRPSSYMSKCWNILKSNNHNAASGHKSSRGSSNGNNNSSGADPLVARRCANCDTTSTPLWRNGPRGPKSLCNACGIRFKKEERRASAAAAATANSGGIGGGNYMDNTSWGHHNSQVQKNMPSCYSSSAYGNEFRFIEDDDHADSDTSIPFWPYMASQHC